MSYYGHLLAADCYYCLFCCARTDDFAQTVAKARRFADTQEACRPKKSVRIVEASDLAHGVSAVPPSQAHFQPWVPTGDPDRFTAAASGGMHDTGDECVGE